MTAAASPAIPDAPPPRSVAVVGLGLIGASLLGALRQALPEVDRIAVGRRAETAERAVADGLATRAGTDAAVLRRAEVVVLCTPVDAMPAWLEAAASAAPRAVLTDAGSTKAWVTGRAIELLGPGRFVGGHPMAGRERSGYDAAEPSLFAGATWILTPSGAAEAELIAPWAAAVTSIGARVEALDPAAHDAAVALISHLPFALSAALVRAAGADPSWEAAWRLASSGFRDTARLAGGDPAMYAAITSTNARPLTEALDAFERQITLLRGVIDDRAAAADYFGAAQRTRADWLRRREGSGRPVL